VTTIPFACQFREGGATSPISLSLIKSASFEYFYALDQLWLRLNYLATGMQVVIADVWLAWGVGRISCL